MIPRGCRYNRIREAFLFFVSEQKCNNLGRINHDQLFLEGLRPVLSISLFSYTETTKKKVEGIEEQRNYKRKRETKKKERKKRKFEKKKKERAEGWKERKEGEGKKERAEG